MPVGRLLPAPRQSVPAGSCKQEKEMVRRARGKEVCSSTSACVCVRGVREEGRGRGGWRVGGGGWGVADS